MFDFWDQRVHGLIVAVVLDCLGFGGWFLYGDAFVGYYAFDVVAVLVELDVAGLDYGPHPVIACWLVGVDHDIISLPTTNQ